jgi:hypothetical protein
MMLAKNPAERYPNAKDLLVDLDLIAHGQPPHVARRMLDSHSIAVALPTQQAQPTVVVQKKPVAAPSALQSPAFMIALVIMAMSLLANIIMIALMAR